LIILNEDGQGNPPMGDTAVAYAQTIGTMGMLVSVDPTNQVYGMTPWDGTARPGKCALAPDMTILACWVGASDTQGYDAIVAHAAAQP
jgi:hypothetical protein